MLSQNEIIHNAEKIIEQYRQEISLLKNETTCEKIRNYFMGLENSLFFIIVLFYTHRSVWSKENFWHEYIGLERGNANQLAGGAYKEIIGTTLVHVYFKFYECLEAIVWYYLSKNGLIKTGAKINFEKMFKEINKKLFDNSLEIENGVKIVRFVRNSSHGEIGPYVYSYEKDECIYYKNKLYVFETGKLVSVSYKFICDFLPDLIFLYKKLSLN